MKREPAQLKTHTYPIDIYRLMMKRCYKPTFKEYTDYGAKGIRVSTHWYNNPHRFVLDMGPRPPARYLQRYDENRNFTKTNCYWGRRIIKQPPKISIIDEMLIKIVLKKLHKLGKNEAIDRAAIKYNIPIEQVERIYESLR